MPRPATASEISDVRAQVMSNCKTALQAEQCTLFLYDEETRELATSGGKRGRDAMANYGKYSLI